MEKKSDTAFWLLKKRLDSGSIPDLENILDLEIISNSMYPLIKIGDKISLKYTAKESLKLGDIIVYLKENNICTHRYLYKLNKNGKFLGLVTKGDNNLSLDAYIVPQGQFLGKVIAITRTNKRMDMESFFWRAVNYLVGILSLTQVLLIEFCCRLKHLLFGKKSLTFLVHIIALPFSASLKFIVNLARAISFSFLKD